MLIFFKVITATNHERARDYITKLQENEARKRQRASKVYDDLSSDKIKDTK